MAEPALGSYACVRIPFLKKSLFGHTFLVPNVFGYAIRIFTRSSYDHAFIYIGNGQIIEAQPKGARISELAEYDGDGLLWSTDTLTDDQRAQIVISAKHLLNTSYGFLDIVYLGLASLGIRFNWLLKRVENEQRLICSQLVALSGRLAGVDAWLCGKENACLVTPADLANRLQK